MQRDLPQLYEPFRSCFVGRAADLAPYYRAARCVIAPMVSGTGISVKTIEALALGKPFIGTSKAFRGLPAGWVERAGLRVHDDPQEFADAIACALARNNRPEPSAARPTINYFLCKPPLRPWMRPFEWPRSAIERNTRLSEFLFKSRRLGLAMPAVSVIVPNYNHARFLSKRIDSVLQQTFQDWELILLDDCSTDDSRSILSRYAGDPRVRIERNEANSGSTFKQWNKGVRLARGKYVWIAESDDYADPRLLERLVAVLETDPAVTFAYCQSWRVSEDDQRIGFADFYLDYLDAHRWKADFCVNGLEECQNYLVSSNTVPNASAVVFRRDIYERVGGADEKMRMCGDWKLWAAMALQGKVAYLGEPLNYFRTHDTSVRSKSNKQALDAAEYLQVIRWIMGRVTPGRSRSEAAMPACRPALWVPALMSMRVPFSLKWSILKNVWAVDPHPVRRAVRPAIRTIRGRSLATARRAPFGRHGQRRADELAPSSHTPPISLP